jgi:carbamoylphosphate synthase small subunit
MKKVLLTTRNIFNNWQEEYLGVSKNLIEILNKENFYVSIETNYYFQDLDYDYLSDFDLVLITGGNSIGEMLTRDNFELGIVKYCEAHNIPLIGICRGMQIISTFFGVNPERLSDHSGTQHSLMGQPEIFVNSYHDYGINRTPDLFLANHISTDGSIESFVHKHKKIAGIMWHPEREIQDNYFKDLIESFINK